MAAFIKINGREYPCPRRVTYPDMVNNTWTTRKMYPGDRTAEPFHLDPETQLPIDYINCKVNLIDCGEPL